ncbi:MAG: hypothetical protein Rubg2KO_33520 [Rubricoccaceae bacterium]
MTLRLAFLTLASALFIFGLAGCAQVPPPLDPPLPLPAAPLDIGRVQALLANRLDTLNIRDTDADRFFNPTRWHEDVRRREMIRDMEGDQSEEFLDLHRLTTIESRDSLRGTYRAGTNDAIRDLERGSFHLKEWSSHRVSIFSTFSGKCFREHDLWHGILWRDFRTLSDYVPFDDRYASYYEGQPWVSEYDGQPIVNYSVYRQMPLPAWVAYAEGYNRVAVPVIESYWGVQDIPSTTYSRMWTYAGSGDPDVISEWGFDC